MRDTDVGIYVHVPFCERICPYCDFAVVAARSLSEDAERRYVDALVRELEARAPEYAGLGLSSIYLGGGTPSLLTPGSVGRIIATARRLFPSSEGGRDAVEVTLEVNPSTVERERLPGFRDAGVNRISLGLQSFDDTVLRRLGRAHRADQGWLTLESARSAGITSLSVDLLFAAPGQGLAQLEGDLDSIVRLEPDHVSTYELSIESGTPFALAEQRGQLHRPSEDDAARMLEHIVARLAEARIHRYEISNYARPGCEAIHNRRYWERKPVLGIGMSAWSTEPRSLAAPHGARSANLRGLHDYLRAVKREGRAVADREVFDAQTARGEALFLGLRCVQGVSAVGFEEEFGGRPRRFYDEEISRLVAQGLLEERLDGSLALSERGRLLADSVAEHFV